jgi:hypothetical protein
MEIGNYTEFQKGTEIVSFTTYIYFVDEYMSYSPSNNRADI